jgi:microcystin-dependent protein
MMNESDFDPYAGSAAGRSFLQSALMFVVVIAVLVMVVLFLGSVAKATCSTGAMPNQLQNNTLADATQVMANFNAISSQVAANCAGSGANNDITSLSALSTPITPSQGGTPLFVGGLTGGAPNAQTITVSSNFTLTPNFRVAGIANFQNTGPATLQVNSTTATNFFRKTQLGVVAMAGGELLAGNPFTAVYNGSVWVLDGETILVGEMKDFSGASAPPGFAIADGSSFACASFPALCSVIGTSFGGTGANPLLPDTRGRVTAGLDSYGTAPGAANRLTVAATGCGTGFTAVGATCANANQSHTQVLAEIAAHNHTITDPGHVHGTTPASFNVLSGVSSPLAGGAGAGEAAFSMQSATTGITINNSGSGQAMPIVNPNLGVVKIIRF